MTYNYTQAMDTAKTTRHSSNVQSKSMKESLVQEILMNESCYNNILKCIQYDKDVLNRLHMIYSYIQGKWATDSKKMNMLHQAVYCGNKTLVKFLLDLGVDVNCKNSSGETSLHMAPCSDICYKPQHKNTVAYENLISCVDRLLSSENIDVNACNNEGSTPLHDAVKFNSDIALMYIKAGANIHARDDKGNYPIHDAVKYGYVDGIQLLIQHGACVNAQNNKGENPLVYLLEVFDIEKCATGPWDSDLGTEKLVENWLELLKMLIDIGCSTDKTDNKGFTALTTAIFNSLELDEVNFHRDALPFLINKNNVDHPDSLGFTPLHYSVLHLNVHAFNCLIQFGCDINAKGYLGRSALHILPFALYEMQQNENITIMEEICEKLWIHGASVEMQDINGRTPLHYAVEIDPDLLVQSILNYSNQSVNTKDKTGTTALHLAAATDNCDLIELLIMNGADITLTDHHLAGPLHYACFNGVDDVVQLLLKHNVNALTKDILGRTPLDIAKEKQFKKCISALIDYNMYELSVGSDTKLSSNFVSADNLDVISIIPKLDNALSSEIQLDEIFGDDGIPPPVELPLMRHPLPLCEILEQYYHVPGVGNVNPGMPEVQDIGDAVTEFIRVLAGKVGGVDKQFCCKLLPSGSYLEGTKVGDADEFDFMCVLEYFSDFVKPCYSDNSNFNEVSLKINDIDCEEHLSEFVEVHEGDPCKYLSGTAVLRKFTFAINKTLINAESYLHPFLSFSHIEKHISFIRDSTPTKIACLLNFTWNGKYYKNLNISVDMVPCLAYGRLPECATTDSRLITHDMKSIGCHFIPKVGSWRISFSLIVKHIMETLSEATKKAYIYAKMLRNICILPGCDVVRLDTSLAKLMAGNLSIHTSLVYKMPTLSSGFNEESNQTLAEFSDSKTFDGDSESKNTFDSLSATIVDHNKSLHLKASIERGNDREMTENRHIVDSSTSTSFVNETIERECGNSSSQSSQSEDVIANSDSINILDGTMFTRIDKAASQNIDVESGTVFTFHGSDVAGSHIITLYPHDIIKTYILKSIFFHVLEDMSGRPASTMEYLRQMFMKLRVCSDERKLQSYFLPGKDLCDNFTREFYKKNDKGENEFFRHTEPEFDVLLTYIEKYLNILC